MKKRIFVLMAMFTPFLSQISHAVSVDKEASDFFEQYQKLWKNFDPKLKDLFSDQVKVTSTIYGDGTETIYKITGLKFKERIEDALKYSEAKNQYDMFSQIQTQKIDQNNYKITAQRYDLENCYTDKVFNMTIQRQENQQLQIIHLEDSDIDVSQCTTPIKQDIPAKLQIAAIAANKELPKAVDRITILEKVTADKNTMTYHYRLDGILREDIDDKLIMYYEDDITNTACKTPLLKKEIDLGVEFQHLVYDSTQQVLVNHTVNKKLCDSYSSQK